MSNVRGHFRLRFYGTLPDEQGAADDAFNRMGEWVTELLNAADDAESVGIVSESFTIEDGDTEPDE